jgi:ribosomal protein L34E
MFGRHKKPYIMEITNATQNGQEWERYSKKQVTVQRCPRCGAPIVSLYEYLRDGNIMVWRTGK